MKVRVVDTLVTVYVTDKCTLLGCALRWTRDHALVQAGLPMVVIALVVLQARVCGNVRSLPGLTCIETCLAVKAVAILARPWLLQ